MDPLILLAIYASLGYFGGLATLSYAGMRLLHEGKTREAIACFRAGACLNLSLRGRVVMQSNLIVALTTLGDLEGANREWAVIASDLDKAGAYKSLAVACYVASLVRQGRYNEGLRIASLVNSCDDTQPDRSVVDFSFNTGLKDLASHGEALRLLNLAGCYLELGQFALASQSLERAESLKVRQELLRSSLFIAKARLAWCLGQTDQAYELAKAVHVGGSPEVYLEVMLLQKALILAICGHPDEAEELLDVRVRVASSGGYYLRPLLEGVIAEMRNCYADAYRQYRLSLRSGQPAGEAAWRGGYLAQRCGDIQEAISFYQEAVRSDYESWWAKAANESLKRLANLQN